MIGPHLVHAIIFVACAIIVIEAIAMWWKAWHR